MKSLLKTLLYLGGLLAFLSYLFWRADLIPEAVSPVVGYIDDSVVALVVLILVARFKKVLKLK